MSTATTPAVVETTALVTVGQAVAGVKEKLLALVDATIAEYQADIDGVAASAAFLDVATTEAEVEDLADKRKRATTLAKELDEARKSLTRRLDALKSEMKGPFDKKIEIAQGAADKITAAARPFVEEKARKAEEERLRQLEIRRKAQEEADRKAQEEREVAREAERKAELARAEERRIEDERAKARTKKDRENLDAQLAQARMAADELEDSAVQATATASVAEDTAAASAVPVNLKAQDNRVRSTSGASLGVSMIWQHEITDPSMVPDRFWIVDEAAIGAEYSNEEARRRIADANGNPKIPGVRIFKAPRMAGR